MKVNRYTRAQPAKYQPRSLQELMMAPQYKRGQHDLLDEKRSELETSLGQTSSLGLHEDRLRQEQQKLYDQMSQQADRLASEGFTPTSKSDFLRLNKQYQQAISPTGEIGKIGAAEKAYNENYKAFMEDAVKNKKWSSEKALENWNKFAGQYTGFDEKGGISNIGQLGAPEKVELMTKLKDAKALLGDQVVNELAAGNYSFARQEDGSLAVVNRSGRRIETSNAPNIQNALGMLNSELSDPESAWRKSIEFEGLDPMLLSNQINQGFASMLNTKVNDTRKQSINFTGVKNLTDMGVTGPNIPSVTEPVKEFNNKRDNLALSLTLIGQPRPKAIVPGQQISPSTQKVGVYTPEDMKPAALDQFNTIYKAMVNKGIINPQVDKFSKENLDLIQQYLKDTETFSYSNKILKPEAVDNELQKPLMFTPKKGFDMDKHLKQEVSGDKPRRKLFDKDTQEIIDLNDYPNYKIEYVGMVSPDNALTKNDASVFNDDSLVLPHVLQITDENGVIKEVYMDRDEEEMKKPEFKASRIIKNITLKGKQAVGMETEYSNADLHSKGIKNIITVYNPSSDTYTATFIDIHGNKVRGENLTSSQLQNNIYRLFKK